MIDFDGDVDAEAKMSSSTEYELRTSGQNRKRETVYGEIQEAILKV